MRFNRKPEYAKSNRRNDLTGRPVDGIATRIMDRLVYLLARLFLDVEPLTPRFVSLLVGRYLRRRRDEGWIFGYRTRVKRLGRYHYRVGVDVDLTERQANVLLGEALERMVGGR